jgi:hypothetical protein
MAKTAINCKKAAKEFADFWQGRGDEKKDKEPFWTSLLRVFGIEKPETVIDFEKRVKINGIKYIDAYIAATNTAIEQKSLGIDLDKKALQSDGSLLTPYEQAKRYNDNLRYSERCRWIVVSNFAEFRIYDMEKEEPEKHFGTVLLENLSNDFESLHFLVDSEKDLIPPETQVSLKAGELVGKLYDAILKQYKNQERAETLKSLNILCVRLVFLLYAEDAGIFPEKDMFGRYLAKFRPEEAREKILNLFAILNTKPEDRDPYLNDDLAAFPYVNGGLFAEREIEIPRFNEEIVDILVNKASAGFDWSKISPTIFGAVFESTLNPETRHQGGMHYTSITNIHKVIDPLFLNDLRHEFSSIVGTRAACPQKNNAREPRALRQKLEQLRNKIASLKFLDPACGSGNFLTETYISLRRLENEILKKIHGNQQLLGSYFSPIKVKISQFYGIEINDFAVTVAKTALWIAESQMMKETEEIVEEDLDFLPLSTSATIVEGNALRMDWRYLCEEEEKIPTITAKKTNLIYPFMIREPEVEYHPGRYYPVKGSDSKYDEINLITDEINVGKPRQKKTENHYDYIMGNPPFVGHQWRSKEQQSDMDTVFKDFGNNHGKLDYVCCWYKKALDIIRGTNVKCAFVSTNSICQGESVATLWKPLFDDALNIDFAWRTFRWDSESTQKAHVHCVIVGFSCRHARGSRAEKNAVEPIAHRQIFNADGTVIEAKNINGYLLDAPNVFIQNRNQNLNPTLPKMSKGSQPTDGGNLILSTDEKDELIRKYPESAKFIRQFMGAEEFINNKKRWCLWLKNVAPDEYRKIPPVIARLERVSEFRRKSPTASVQRDSETPMLFTQIRQPETDYLAIPRVSSENRKYIPIGFMKPDIILSDRVSYISNATLYLFGVMSSNVHNAWMRVVCGRLKSDYNYSPFIYNNFPWPDVETSPETSHKRKTVANAKERCQVTSLRDKVEQTAQAILDARAKYPDSSLADLYDETTMPPDLRKAHKENDKAVMAAYGFNSKMSESEIVAELFKMYERLIKKEID